MSFKFWQLASSALCVHSLKARRYEALVILVQHGVESFLDSVHCPNSKVLIVNEYGFEAVSCLLLLMKKLL